MEFTLMTRVIRCDSNTIAVPAKEEDRVVADENLDILPDRSGVETALEAVCTDSKNVRIE
jgi:hypothetical protein